MHHIDPTSKSRHNSQDSSEDENANPNNSGNFDLDNENELKKTNTPRDFYYHNPFEKKPTTHEELIEYLKEKSWSRLVNSYYTIFPPDSWDANTDEFNGRNPISPHEKNIIEEYKDVYLNNYITALTSFFYMPNRSTNGVQSWENIGRNWLGLEKDQDTWRENFNIAATIYSLPKNVFWFAVWTSRNILAFCTEFLFDATSVLANFAEDYGQGMIEIEPELHPAKVTGYKALKYFGLGLRHGLKALSQVCKLVTTPGQASRDAWKLGHDIAGDGIIGDILGGAFWAGSVALTATIYFFLGQALIPIFTSLFTVTSTTMTITAVAPVVFKTLGIIYGVAGSVLGTGIAIAGSVISRRVIKPIRDYWYSTELKPSKAKLDDISVVLQKPEVSDSIKESTTYQSIADFTSKTIEMIDHAFTLSPETRAKIKPIFDSVGDVIDIIEAKTVEPIRQYMEGIDHNKLGASNYQPISAVDRDKSLIDSSNPNLNNLNNNFTLPEIDNTQHQNPQILEQNNQSVGSIMHLSGSSEDLSDQSNSEQTSTSSSQSSDSDQSQITPRQESGSLSRSPSHENLMKSQPSNFQSQSQLNNNPPQKIQSVNRIKPSNLTPLEVAPLLTTAEKATGKTPRTPNKRNHSHRRDPSQNLVRLQEQITIPNYPNTSTLFPQQIETNKTNTDLEIIEEENETITLTIKKNGTQ